MSKCPHCDRELRLTDWKANCPGCGVNLMFYGFEERFYEDAKRSELSMAGMRAKMKRFKASFNGSTLAKMHLIVCALPLVTLLLPMGELRANLPFAGKQWSAGLLGLVSAVMDGGLGEIPYLQGMLDSGQSALFRVGLLLLGASILAAVMGVLVLLFSFFSFLSVKRMSTLTGVVSILGALVCAGGLAAGLLLRRESQALGSAIYSGSMGFGAPLSFVLFGFTCAANLLLAKKGIPVTYAEGDFERAEIFKRVKRGEVKLADLPFPVVETEETREREAKIAEELGGVSA